MTDTNATGRRGNRSTKMTDTCRCPRPMYTKRAGAEVCHACGKVSERFSVRTSLMHWTSERDRFTDELAALDVIVTTMARLQPGSGEHPVIQILEALSHLPDDGRDAGHHALLSLNNADLRRAEVQMQLSKAEEFVRRALARCKEVGINV